MIWRYKVGVSIIWVLELYLQENKIPCSTRKPAVSVFYFRKFDYCTIFPQPSSKCIMLYSVRQYFLLLLNTSLHRLPNTLSMKEWPLKINKVDEEWMQINLWTSLNSRKNKNPNLHCTQTLKPWRMYSLSRALWKSSSQFLNYEHVHICIFCSLTWKF